MLHSVYESDLSLIEGPVDDAIVTPSSRAEAFQVADERFPEAMPVRGDRTEDRLERGMSHLVGESVEVAETVGGDLDVVHRRDLHVVAQARAFSL